MPDLHAPDDILAFDPPRRAAPAPRPVGLPSRAASAARRLAGREIADALSLAEPLAPSAGCAFPLALLRAVEAAEGVSPDPAHEAARATIALACAVAAHAWRIGVVWPGDAGKPRRTAQAATLRRAASRAPGLVYPAGDWLTPGGGALRVNPMALAGDVAGIMAGAMELGLSPSAFDAIVLKDRLAAPSLGPARHLFAALKREEPGLQTGVALAPVLDAATLAAAMDADADLDLDPHLGGRGLEVGAYASLKDDPRIAAAEARWGGGVASRFAAQFLAACRAAERLARSARVLPEAEGEAMRGLGAGAGLGLVETAYGPLAIFVRTAGGRLSICRAIGPSDWNFATRGPFAAAWRRIEPKGREAERLALAFDPAAPVAFLA